MTSTVSGWLIYQNTYALVSTTVSIVVGWGLGGIIWQLSKKTGNIQFHTMYYANITKFFLNFRNAKSKLNAQQKLLLCLFIAALFTSQLGTLLNLVVTQYIGLGVISTIQATNVAGLGPLSYLNAIKLADDGNITNTINYGLLAHLFQNSTLLNSGSTCNSKTAATCYVDIPIDTSCNPTNNALMNAQNAIADKGTGFLRNTIYPPVVYDNFDTIQSANSYMGTGTVSAVIRSTTNNNVNFIFQSISTAIDSSYYFQPLFSSASLGASYLITWGLKGQLGLTGSKQAQNDTLTTSLIDVVNVQFGSASSSYISLQKLNAPSFCYQTFSLAGSTYFCNPPAIDGTGLNATDGTESFEFVVFGASLDDLNSQTTTLLPFTQASYVSTSFDGNLQLNADGSVKSQSFDKTAGVKYFWRNFRVTTKTQTVVTYNEPSISSKPPTAILTSLGSFSSDCKRGNARGVFNPSSAFIPGQVVVIISTAFVGTFVVFGFICLCLWWFNDSSAVLTARLKPAFSNDAEYSNDPKNAFVKQVFFDDLDGKVADTKLAQPSAPELQSVKVEIKE